MKLVIQRSRLQQGLARIQGIVEKRNSMPILANVLLDATKTRQAGHLHLAATDLEVGIRGSHEAEVEKPGTITVSARKLYDIVRELPDEPIQLVGGDNAYLEIRCGRSRFSLAGASADEYPALPELSPAHLVRLPAAVVSMMVEKTMYATSLDETRYNLNGVYIEVEAETSKLRMVATDGHRLALVERTVGVGIEGLASGVIIPRKGLAELKRLVDEDDADEIELGFEGNSGLVRKADVSVVMRLIEGEFPDYRKVIPKEAGHELSLPTEDLVRALRRTVLLAAERSHAVRFEVSEGRLVISSSNPDLGEAQEELDVDFHGESIAIGFNARYLLDCLAVVGSKEVRIGFVDANAPARIRPIDDEGSLAVVMPMRL